MQQNEFKPRQLDTLKGRMPVDPKSIVRLFLCLFSTF